MAKLVDTLAGQFVLKKVNSPINGELTVIKDIVWGTYIHGGGLPQSGGLAEKIWRASLSEVHSQKKDVKKALILGLGGGAIAKLIRKHWPDSRITGVDIDPIMVELGKEYLNLDKWDVEVFIKDAYEFIRKETLATNKYDLICVDTYIQSTYPKKFADERFLNNVKSALSKNGIAVFNRLYGDEEKPEVEQFKKKLEKVFKKVTPVYPEANVMFVCSS